jgi:integrase
VFGIQGEVAGKPLSTKRASRYIAAIGERARVVTDPNSLRERVDKETGAVTMVPGTATAHDLRRSFGTRWSQKVMPRVLMQLMRHTSITTTMKYYVENNADSVAEELWGLVGSSLGSSSQNQDPTAAGATQSNCSNSLATNA